MPMRLFRIAFPVLILGMSCSSVVFGAENSLKAFSGKPRQLPANIAAMVAFRRRQQEAWNRKFRQKRPRAQIQQIMLPRQSQDLVVVKTLIYYPDVDLNDVQFFVDAKPQGISYAVQPNTGSLLGTCSYAFSFPAQVLRDGRHRLMVRDRLTSDEDSRTIWVKAGRVTRIAR
jgi:hypothetical protein